MYKLGPLYNLLLFLVAIIQLDSHLSFSADLSIVLYKFLDTYVSIFELGRCTFGFRVLDDGSPSPCLTISHLDQALPGAEKKLDVPAPVVDMIQL